MASSFLLLGSNMGNKQLNLTNASEQIVKRIGKVIQSSKIYETEPWGEKEQEHFLNQAVEVATDLTPDELMDTIKEIEAYLEREETYKWGPRVIDIDILFYDEEMICEMDLTIPHPFIHERKCTLIPLSEIAAEKYHPCMGMTVIDMLIECQDESEVKEYRQTIKS